MTPTTDINEVLALLRQMLEQQRQDEALEMMATLLAQLRDQNNELQLRLGKLLKQQYGRKSEKLDAAQLSLFLAQAEKALAAMPAPSALPPAPEAENAAREANLPGLKAAPRKGHGRRPLPAALPREEVSHPVPPKERICETCGREKVCIGHVKSEVLEFIPASFKVLVHVQEKLACKPCGEGVVIGPAADRVIDRGLPGPGLLTQLLLSKYKDSLPLHRLSTIFARSGVTFAVSTLSGWVGSGADMLVPIASRILAEAVAAHLLQTDDTGLKVLDRDHPAGVKRGHVWVYVGDGRWAAFEYTPDWKSEAPRAVLAGRRGWLLHDAYAGYRKLHAQESGCIEVGCWAHTRRPFVEVLDAGDVRAAVPLSLIHRLYEVERVATEDGVGHVERRLRREQQSRPLVEQLRRWMADTHNREPPKSPLAKAIAYPINRWEALLRFLEDGRLPLDNNAAERALRAIAVGRKNYLFAGSDAGARRAAILYTIIGTCALNGVEPWAYLHDVLGKLAAGWPQRRLAELLPPNWAAQH